MGLLGIKLPNNVAVVVIIGYGIIGPREISGCVGIGMSHQVAANLHLHLQGKEKRRKKEKKKRRIEPEMVEGFLFVELGLGNGDRRKRGDGVGEFIPKEGKKRLMSGKTES